jgi:hypothetical protein
LIFLPTVLINMTSETTSIVSSAASSGSDYEDAIGDHTEIDSGELRILVETLEDFKDAESSSRDIAVPTQLTSLQSEAVYENLFPWKKLLPWCLLGKMVWCGMRL